MVKLKSRLNGQNGCSDALQPFIFVALKQIKGYE